MFQLILTAALFLSVGTVLFLFIRALPRVPGEDGAPRKRFQRLESLVTGDLPERIDAAITKHSTRVLHRTKVTLMKLDNSVSRRLRRMKENGDGAGAPPDFSDAHQENSQEK